MEQVTWYVGIDWGSASHAVCLVDATGRRRDERHIVHTAEAVQACLEGIITSAGVAPAQIAVAIETPRGALIDACLARGLLVFAVNPKQLDRFRDRHTVAGAKDDRRDAWVLADSLRTDPAAFQRVHQEDPVVVQLRELSRAEDDLDGEFRRLANQLRSQVHRVEPALLTLCPGADEPWFWALLEAAPTPAAQRRLTRARSIICYARIAFVAGAAPMSWSVCRGRAFRTRPGSSKPWTRRFGVRVGRNRRRAAVGFAGASVRKLWQRIRLRRRGALLWSARSL